MGDGSPFSYKKGVLIVPVYKDKERNTWYFKVRYKDIFGRSKQKLKRGFAKRSDAIKGESDFISSIKDAFTDEITFDEVFEHNISFKTYKEKTIRRRKNEYKKHIQPNFGKMKVKDLRIHHVLEFKTHLELHFNSLNSARTVYANFKILVNHAVKYYGLRNNPCLNVESIKQVKPTVNFIKREEFDKRVQALNTHYYKELTILLFYTGLRVGEGMALTWKDVDFDNKQLHVNKTLNLLTREVGEPKTHASNGYIPFPQFIDEMLQNIKKESAQKLYGFNDDYFIFGGLTPYHYSYYREKFKKVFHDIRIHDLRHSYASYLINKGVDIYLVKELMRHEDIKQTANTYGHLYVERKQQIMHIFDE